MIRTAAFAALAAIALFGQTKPSLTFEVTSVKPNHSEDFRSIRVQFVGSRFSAVNMPLLFLISDAYGVPFQSTRVVGMPGWVQERFDIDAKAAEDALPPGLPTSELKERKRALLESLLADRFKMAAHRESKEMQFYSLVLAKNGPKLDKASIEEKDCVEDPTPDQVHCHAFNGGQGRGLHAKAANMHDLAGFIENWTDHPVIDNTNLSGLFVIESTGWTPMRQPPAPQPAPGTAPAPVPINGPPTGEAAMNDPTRPTLFMVLQKLGLDLKLQKGPVEVFVIDHLERPAAN